MPRNKQSSPAKNTKSKEKQEPKTKTEPAPPPVYPNPKAMQNALLIALEHLQNTSDTDMRKWAEQNPTEFYKMAAKFIPVADGGETGDALAPITQIEIIHTYEDKRQQDIA